jgi:hypothetical protein
LLFEGDDMSAKFDPYHRWLAIPPEEQPPNHYRLLGVKLFETDEDVISAAVDQRMMHLRSFQTGPHGSESQRLLNEVSQASRTLLDPDDRRRYDAQLRAALARRQPSLGTATVFSDAGGPASNLAATVAKLADESNDLTLLVEDLTVAPVQEVKTPPAKGKSTKLDVEKLPDLSADLYELDTPETPAAPAAASGPLSRPAPLSRPVPLSRRPSPAATEKGIHPAIWAAAGGGGLLVLLLILSAIVPAMDFLGIFHGSTEVSARAKPEDEPQARPDPSIGRKSKPAVESNGQSNTPVDPPVKDRSKPPDTGAKTEVKQSEPTVKAPDPEPPLPKETESPVPPKVELKFPRQFELPPVKDTAPVTLGTVPADMMINSIRLFSEAARLGEDEYFTADPENTMEAPLKWRVFIGRTNAADRTRPGLAEISRNGDVVRFRWLADAATEPKSAQLCNATLLIETPDASPRIALRKVDAPEPITLDLQRPTIQRELKLASLPKTENLFLQIGDLAALPVTARIGEEVSEAPEKQPLSIQFPAAIPQQRPEARVAFEVAGADKLVVTVKPVLVTTAEEIPWTMDRLTTQKAAAAKALDAARRNAKIEDGKLPPLRKKHDIAQRKSKTAQGIEKTRTETAMLDLQREMENIINARDEQRKQAESWQKVVESFPELEKMTKTVHNTGKLEFRLFARTPDADIELVRTPGYR